MLRIGRDLAAEDVAPAHVGLGPLVEVGDVHELMVHEPEDALVRDKRFERVRDRRDVEQHHVLRHRGRTGVTVVDEVLEQDRDLAVRLPAPQAFLEGERIFEAARRVRRQIVFGRVKPDQLEVVGLELLQRRFAE